MSDLVSISPEAAYATKPNILVPKHVGAAGKLHIENRAQTDLQAHMGQETGGRDSAAKNVSHTVPTMTTTQEA
jgi:hypothetical protein